MKKLFGLILIVLGLFIAVELSGILAIIGVGLAILGLLMTWGHEKGGKK